MKLCTSAIVLIVNLVATSMATPARPVNYQQPSFLYPSLALPQRLMLFPYLQQPSSSKTHSRLTNDVSDDQQGTAVSATSSEYEEPQYYSELEPEAVQITQDSIQEVVPETPEDSEVQQFPEDLPIETELETVAVPETSAVEQPQDVTNEEDAEGDTIDIIAVPKPSSKRAPKATPLTPLPAGTFFPITVNGHSGASVAIANSFSTGEGGSATSHAIAYGQPEAPKPRSRPDRRH